jgi:hypothetical protein
VEALLGKGLKWSCPHSLGELIEWKLKGHIKDLFCNDSPHSLGELIEWKQKIGNIRGA